MSNNRIQWMDGLRGVAILSVIVYHLFGPQFASWLPYGDSFSHLYPARFGWAGVELFFLISGFVILMTLERCGNLAEFASRRWLRLFPAMLTASVLILLYDKLVGVGPFSQRSLPDLIPGLTFLSPSLIHTLTRVQLHSMDGPFWSLYVEVAFYAMFGSVYFWRGWKWALGVILALFAATYILLSLPLAPGSFIARLGEMMAWLGFICFSWFAAGALYFKAAQEKSRTLFWLATALACGACLTQKDYLGQDAASKVALLVVVALFASAQLVSGVQRILSHRFLVFVGFVSYPLYLIHENIGVGVIHILGRYVRPSPLDALLMFIPVSAVMVGSWLIARFAEPAIRRALITVRVFCGAQLPTRAA